ncbi:ligase-associated DNA damage response endonuclease PdeM [Winogradskyella sp. UBA3174]|uniref:ligase-associated DNA damage response endonuclease PdeM n=1 Tax=Winogradskyella sp. UBA3174 TaxID=1947785 RepID=UPI0025F78AC2|nr:ligase-associated DNA damage response endonuclease PdeM [Winogradskyella sp. UBA3174]|tara:strand:+ start:5942 stop:6589 length:648 start_codon:yes stop_codon:yes gene_type:complete
MNIAEEFIKIRNEELVLTNQRAIYWKRENALILSDLHIGKTGHFKKHGIPMPDAILQKDLERLEALTLHFKAKYLFVVGDLFHAEANEDMTTFKNWLLKFEFLKIILIKGNHDRLSKTMMVDFNIQVEIELEIDPFLLVHEHLEIHKENFTISGHTHPGVLLKGKGRQRLKLPCYQVASNQIILPAFSLFTGLNTRAQLKDTVTYAFTETSIFKF